MKYTTIIAALALCLLINTSVATDVSRRRLDDDEPEWADDYEDYVEEICGEDTNAEDMGWYSVEECEMYAFWDTCYDNLEVLMSVGVYDDVEECVDDVFEIEVEAWADDVSYIEDLCADSGYDDYDLWFSDAEDCEWFFSDWCEGAWFFADTEECVDFVADGFDSDEDFDY